MTAAIIINNGATVITDPNAALVGALVTDAQAASAEAQAARDDAAQIAENLADTGEPGLFGLKGNAVKATNPTGFTSGGYTFTLAGLTSADVGKVIWCSRIGSGYTSPILPVGTITNVSGTTITTSTAWTEAYGSGTTYELIYGDDDTAALTAMGTLAQTTGQLRLPAGRFILRSCPIDWTGQTKPLCIRGAGGNVTSIHIAPDYNFSSTNGDAFSCLLYKGAAPGEVYRSYFGGFGLYGPLHQFSGKSSYNGLTQIWVDGLVEDVGIEQLSGLFAGLRCSARTIIHNVRSKQHLSGGTHGIFANNWIRGEQIHTGNCNGAGLRLSALDGTTSYNQEPATITSSIFDECDGHAVYADAIKEFTFVGCTMFGGPNTVSWALYSTGVCSLNFIRCSITGYGTASPRKAMFIGTSGTVVRAMQNTLIHRAGDGTGGSSLSITSGATLFLDETSTLGPNVTGAGTVTQLIVPSAFMKTLLDDADAATARTTLGITAAGLAAGDTFLAANGTASAPGVAFNSDTNTGIYSPSADTIRIATGGANRVSVKSDGKVGVGTINPVRELQVYNSTNARMICATDDRNDGFFVTPAVGMVATSSVAAFGSMSNHALEFWINGGARAVLETGGALRSGADNAYSSGTAPYRWSVVYAGTGTINTSDARDKTWRGGLNAAEKAAARDIIAEIGIFQWNDAIAEKGDDARLHVGVRAQEVWRIMAKHKLVDKIGKDGRPVATPYAFLCYDEWEADEDEGRAAGNRFGVRIDQLMMFLLAALVAA